MYDGQRQVVGTDDAFPQGSWPPLKREMEVAGRSSLGL